MGKSMATRRRRLCRILEDEESWVPRFTWKLVSNATFPYPLPSCAIRREASNGYGDVGSVCISLSRLWCRPTACNCVEVVCALTRNYVVTRSQMGAQCPLARVILPISRGFVDRNRVVVFDDRCVRLTWAGPRNGETYECQAGKLSIVDHDTGQSVTGIPPKPPKRPSRFFQGLDTRHRGFL